MKRQFRDVCDSGELTAAQLILLLVASNFVFSKKSNYSFQWLYASAPTQVSPNQSLTAKLAGFLSLRCNELSAEKAKAQGLAPSALLRAGFQAHALRATNEKGAACGCAFLISSLFLL
jgi:hypothetical protein